MSNGEHIEEIKKILDDGDVPRRVENSMILSAISMLWHRIDRQGDCLEQIRLLNERITHLEEDRAENPPLFAYIKERPVRAVGLLIGFIVVMTIAFSMSEPLRAWAATLVP